MTKPPVEPKAEQSETIKRYRCLTGNVQNSLTQKHGRNFEFYEPRKGYCQGIPKNKEERTEKTYKSLCTMCTLSVGARAIRATHKEYQSTHQTPKSLHWHRNQARNKSMTPGSNRVGHSRTPRTPNRSPFATRTPNLTPHSTPQKPPRIDCESTFSIGNEIISKSLKRPNRPPSRNRNLNMSIQASPVTLQKA